MEETPGAQLHKSSSATFLKCHATPSVRHMVLREINKQINSSGSDPSFFSMVFLLLLGLWGFLPKYLFKRYQQIPPHTQRTGRAAQRVPCFGPVSWRVVGLSTTWLQWHHKCGCIGAIFINFTWEQTNVAQHTETRRCNLSQQNVALEKASSFSSKPHILVRLTNAAGDTGPQHSCWGQRLCCPPPSPLPHPHLPSQELLDCMGISGKR